MMVKTTLTLLTLFIVTMSAIVITASPIAGFGITGAATITHREGMTKMQAPNGHSILEWFWSLFTRNDLITGAAIANVCECGKSEFTAQQNCNDCEAKLNSANCDEVKLVVDIVGAPAVCINSPISFSNKIFNAREHTIS